MFALWIILLLIAGLLLVAARFFLREQRIDVISRIRDLSHQPIPVLVFVCMFVCALVQYASNKLPPLPAPPLFNLPTLNSEPIIIDPQLALSNLQFTAIYPLSNSVLLGVGWAATNPPPDEMIDIYSTSNLVSGVWEAIGSAFAPSNAPGVEVEVPHSALVGGETNIAFFAMGLRVDSDGEVLTDSYERLVSCTDPNLADTDGDGLPDGWEV